MGQLANLANWAGGEVIRFTGIDPDFTGNSSAGVRVQDMAGARAQVLFDDGTTGFGEFQPKNGVLQAVISK